MKKTGANPKGRTTCPKTKKATETNVGAAASAIALRIPETASEETFEAAPPREHRARETLEECRGRQREVCALLLERWVPLATAAELALRKEGRSGPVIDEEPFEAGLKAGAFVLKVLERLARLDGLDAAEKREVMLTELADPLELARRVKAVSPILAGRGLGQGHERLGSGTGGTGISTDSVGSVEPVDSGHSVESGSLLAAPPI